MPISPEQRRAALQHFDALSDADAAERRRVLDSLLREDPTVAALLERMLDDDGREDGLLDGSLRHLAPTVVADLESAAPAGQDGAAPPPEIPGLRILGPLGSGGMGEVFLAERRNDGLSQKVALKLLRGGFDSHELRRRFLRERQILAWLEHPDIARFIDAGLTADGRPWLAMEYVEGTPIDVHVRQHALDLRARVALLVQVCRAVAHAQSRLVVHRDIKPSNILVDADGRPRLLDFGIAKLLEDDLGPAATRTGVRAMSPAYAAPEQILDQPISTATDVYALGLVLYELITGQLPHRRSGSLETLSREVTGESVVRPSQVLRQAASSTTLGLDAAALARLRRGVDADLDSVVLNALRPEPERRYANAAEFAEDLCAWLERRPVKARPDTVGYRMRRFARRHAVGVAASAAVALALLIGLGAALHQAAEASRQAERADLEAARAESEAESAIAQATLAREQAERARRAVAFLTSLFRDDDPMMVAARGRMSMDEAFEDALSRIDAGFDDDPALKADLLDDFGEILAVKGRLEDAETRIRQALALAIQAHGEEHPAVAESLDNLGVLALMRGDPASGLEHARRSLAIREQHKDSDPAAYAIAANGLAVAHHHSGRPDEAARWLRVALDAFASSLGDDSPRTDAVRSNLGAVLIGQSRYAEAEPLLGAVLAGMERRGEDESAAMLPLLSRLGQIAYARDDLDAESRYAMRRLELARRLYPEDHIWHAEALVEAGEVAERRGGNGLAELANGTAMYARLGHTDEAEARGAWGLALARRGEFAEALAVLGRIDALCEGEERSATTVCFMARQSRANALVSAGRPAEALAEADGQLAWLQARYEADTRHRADALEVRGRALHALGRSEEARADLSRAREILATLYGAGHASTRRIAQQLDQMEPSQVAPEASGP